MAQPAAGLGVTGQRAFREQFVGGDRARRVVTTAAGGYPYDALVLATGSYAFVPPVDGTDLPGVFVYRTLDDLAAIREHARGRRTGVVIGGGLLGLEAANALRLLGLTTSVVEFAPRLMPVQVDEAGGSMLRRYVEELAVTPYVGVATTALRPGPDGTVAALDLADGRTLDAELVVVAAGIRPRDELARASGLEVGPRGGVVVDDAMRTSDPEILAARLAGRGRESRGEILARLARTISCETTGQSIPLDNSGPKEIAGDRLVAIIRKAVAFANISGTV